MLFCNHLAIIKKEKKMCLEELTNNHNEVLFVKLKVTVQKQFPFLICIYC